MKRQTIIIIALVVILIGAVTYFMLTRGEKPKDDEGDDEQEEQEDEEEEEEDEEEEDQEPQAPQEHMPTEIHPLVGEKYITTGGGVIKPTTEGENGFEIVKSGVRMKEMIIKFEPVLQEDDTYFLYSKGLNKYMKIVDGGFEYQAAKPTTGSAQYEIKFVAIGEKLLMSYKDATGKTFFIGDDGSGQAMKKVENVTEIMNTGSIQVEDAKNSGFVLPGHFGNNFLSDYGTAEIENIQDCLTKLDEMDKDITKNVISVAYRKSEEGSNPCRAYVLNDDYKYDKNSTEWVTTCVKPEKNIEQGCLIDI